MELKNLQFGELNPEKEEIASKPSKLIPLDVEDIPLHPFPANDSGETRSELKYVTHVIENYDFHKGEREKLDTGFVDLLFEYADENDLTYDRENITTLVEDFTHLILRLKKFYNRPRPFQVAPHHEIDVKYNDAIQSGRGTASSPSYPSGHTAQAYLAAELLAQQHPNHKEGFINIAERVALARLKEGVHFQSDNDFSKVLVRNYVLPALEKKVYLNTKPKSRTEMSASLPYKYTTSFRQEILAASKIESGEWKISKASLEKLRPLIPTNIDFEKNIDLLGVAFNAAVVNRFNKNDDGIDTKTALAIKDYFVNKPTNLEHQKQKVVGHIVSSAFSKFPTNEIIEDVAVKDKVDPFNIACAAVVYRTVNRPFADLIQDEDGGFDKKISASWEIGFNDYCIALGSKDLRDAEVITDDVQIAEFSNYLKANEGPGELDDGTKVYRLVVGNIYPLGIGFTTNPAADVEGLILQKHKEEDNPEIALAPQGDAEMIAVNNHKFIKNLKTPKNKNSQNLKKAVNSNQTINLKNMENEILDKLERVLKEHDYAKEFSQEAVASVTSIVEEAIRQKSDEYVAEKEKVAEAEKQLEEAATAHKESLSEVEEKLTAAEVKIADLEAAQAEREAKDAFNARMGVVDEIYELDDEDRKMVARELVSLDLSEESFADYQEKVSVLWKHKNKESIQKQQAEFDAKIQAEVEKRLGELSTASTAAVENSEATVEEALENVEEQVSELPNNSEASADEETLHDKFKKAFSKENITINY
jgi:hypothetical protein|tara:strand:+ start:2830 stop:5112 length:2283 start_codon:yes stop_codon:yes gene_type:complete